jgi:hypothetical protein
MATCPLCSERPAKRYCPAKDVQICAVCCGTKREVEIDCPSSCPYLKASRSYELEKPIVDQELLARLRKYDETFMQHHYLVLDAITMAVLEERAASPWLVDRDAIEAYKALTATMKTLSSGIYYESLPDSPVQVALFRRIKALLDEMMQPDGGPDLRALKVSEAIEALDFLLLTAEVNTSVRSRSRRYLDLIGDQMAERNPLLSQSSGLILP